MRVPGRKAGLIPERRSEFWEKIEGSAEALWAGHSPMPIPPTKNLATKPAGDRTDKTAGSDRKPIDSRVLRIACYHGHN